MCCLPSENYFVFPSGCSSFACILRVCVCVANMRSMPLRAAKGNAYRSFQTLVATSLKITINNSCQQQHHHMNIIGTLVKACMMRTVIVRTQLDLLPAQARAPFLKPAQQLPQVPSTEVDARPGPQAQHQTQKAMPMVMYSSSKP